MVGSLTVFCKLCSVGKEVLMFGDTQGFLAGGDVVSGALGCQPVHVQEEKLLVNVDLAPALKVQPVENLPDLGGKMIEALSKRRLTVSWIQVVPDPR